MTEITREEIEREKVQAAYDECYKIYSFYSEHRNTILNILRAELTRQENAPLTWNERINWMTVEEKAWYFVYYHEQSNYEENRLGEVIEVATIGYKTSLAPEQYFYDEADAIAATVKILRSPYTEGEKV